MLPSSESAVRQQLLTWLSSYTPNDPQELTSAQKMLQFLKTHETILAKANLLGHVTGSAVILSPDRQRVLLVHHRKLDCWLAPGGHTDPNEHPADAALREAQEETGLLSLEHLAVGSPAEPIDIDAHTIPAHQNDAEHTHFDLRYVLLAHDTTTQLSHESTDIRWFPWEELAALELNYNTWRMLEKARATYT